MGAHIAPGRRGVVEPEVSWTFQATKTVDTVTSTKVATCCGDRGTCPPPPRPGAEVDRRASSWVGTSMSGAGEVGPSWRRPWCHQAGSRRSDESPAARRGNTDPDGNDEAGRRTSGSRPEQQHDCGEVEADVSQIAIASCPGVKAATATRPNTNKPNGSAADAAKITEDTAAAMTARTDMPAPTTDALKSRPRAISSVSGAATTVIASRPRRSSGLSTEATRLRAGRRHPVTEEQEDHLYSRMKTNWVATPARPAGMSMRSSPSRDRRQLRPARRRGAGQRGKPQRCIDDGQPTGGHTVVVVGQPAAGGRYGRVPRRCWPTPTVPSPWGDDKTCENAGSQDAAEKPDDRQDDPLCRRHDA